MGMEARVGALTTTLCPWVGGGGSQCLQGGAEKQREVGDFHAITRARCLPASAQAMFGGSPERKAGIRVEKGSETTCGCEA